MVGLFAQQEEPEELPEIVVTASRLELSPERVGSSVTLVTGEQIQRSNVKSVGELLKDVSGLDLAQSGWMGKITTTFLRGGNSSHTLVLLDGVRINSPTTGAFNFADLTVENIERIEVIRGPQGILYGSEAIGGIISIFTKRGHGKPSISFKSEFGSFKTIKESIQLAGAQDKFDYSVAVSYTETDGISAASEQRGNREDDGYDNLTSSTRLGFNLLKDARIELSFRTISAETELDGYTWGVGPSDDPNYVQDTRSLFGSLCIRKPLYQWWTPSISVSAVDTQLEGSDPDTAFNNYLIETRRRRFENQNIFTVKRLTSILGLEYETQYGKNKGKFKEEVINRAIFLENRFELIQDQLFLTGGIRYDSHSTFGGHNTYRFTAAYLLKDLGVRFHGSYGTGFRAPSLNELFYPGFGNQDLDPEKSRGFDLGVQKRLFEQRLTLDLTYFQNDFDDLISYDPVTFTAQNIDRSEARGIEFDLSLTPKEGINIGVTYTYTDSEDKETGKQLPWRAKYKGAVQVDLNPLEGLTITTSWIMVRDRIDVDGSKMDDYARVDLTAGYELIEQVRIFGRIENIFDREYEDVRGYSSAGRSFFGGAEISW
jgi:vitamin B12 transporter